MKKSKRVLSAALAILLIAAAAAGIAYAVKKTTSGGTCELTSSVGSIKIEIEK